MPIERPNYIFIDYENVREFDLSLIENKPVKVIIATGRQQKSLPKDLVIKLLRFSSQVELVENEHAGKNALDFVLTYEVARHVHQDPNGYFCIVSKDKGFDAVIKHLRAQSVLANRIEDFSRILVLSDASKLPISELADRYWEWVSNPKSSSPAKRKTLLSQIYSYFGKTLTDAKCEAVVKRLINLKRLTISDTERVTYSSS